MPGDDGGIKQVNHNFHIDYQNITISFMLFSCKYDNENDLYPYDDCKSYEGCYMIMDETRSIFIKSKT